MNKWQKQARRQQRKITALLGQCVTFVEQILAFRKVFGKQGFLTHGKMAGEV